MSVRTEGNERESETPRVNDAVITFQFVEQLNNDKTLPIIFRIVCLKAMCVHVLVPPSSLFLNYQSNIVIINAPPSLTMF